MKTLFASTCAAIVVLGLLSQARADDAKDATAILDKAIKALGGEEKLSKAKMSNWKAHGKIRFGENESDVNIEVTVDGLDRTRRVFEGQFGGNMVRGVTVLAGDKGTRKFGDNQTEMDASAVANEKRTLYLTIVPTTVVQLKGKDFKVATAGEEAVSGKPAVGIKATGPDGKDFTLFFDKESGLPVKQVARVVGFRGDEFTNETTYGGYKEMGGIKKAAKIESKRDGQRFQDLEITDFKVLDKVDPKTFSEAE